MRNRKQMAMFGVFSFAVLVGAATPAKAPAAEGEKPTGITEITLERLPGNETNTSSAKDKIVIRPDEPDTYATYSFNKLSHWLEAEGYFDLKDRYDAGAPEGCSSVVMTVVKNGASKQVVNYCHAGDKETWEMEMVIRGVGDDIRKRFISHRKFKS